MGMAMCMQVLGSTDNWYASAYTIKSRSTTSVLLSVYRQLLIDYRQPDTLTQAKTLDCGLLLHALRWSNGSAVRAETDAQRRTDGQTNRRYKVHYLSASRCYAVDKDV